MFTFLVKYPVVVALGALALMSGILSVFREWWMFSHPTEVNQRLLFWTCLRIAFIASALLALYGSYQRGQSLEEQLNRALDRSTPKLSLTIDMIGVLGNKDVPNVYFTLWAALSNSPTGAPSVADDWRLEVIDPESKNTYGTEVVVVPQTLSVPSGDGKTITVNGEALYEKSMKPVTAGEKIRGILRFRLPGVELSKLSPNLILKLKCKDILGNDVTTQAHWSAAKREAFKYYPGTEMPEIK